MTAFTVRNTVPAAVRASFAVWVTLPLFTMIGAVALLIGSGAANAAGVGSAAGESTTVLAATAGLVIVLSLVQVWFATRMRRGANWARIVLTALGALSLFTLWGDAVRSFYGWLQFAAVLAAVVLMWWTSNSNHFRRATA
ncbi:hypothetical protein [Nocardia sp. NPDC006630]|uniref:hypothetical protein n=1 Tax=Nocardia sp. NPDC006630 TaxID=3157181 RepID=UPI0033A02EE6